jgi:hypothetical protein
MKLVTVGTATVVYSIYTLTLNPDGSAVIAIDKTATFADGTVNDIGAMQFQIDPTSSSAILDSVIANPVSGTRRDDLYAAILTALQAGGELPPSGTLG